MGMSFHINSMNFNTPSKKVINMGTPQEFNHDSQLDTSIHNGISRLDSPSGKLPPTSMPIESTIYDSILNSRVRAQSTPTRGYSQHMPCMDKFRWKHCLQKQVIKGEIQCVQIANLDRRKILLRRKSIYFCVLYLSELYWYLSEADAKQGKNLQHRFKIAYARVLNPLNDQLDTSIDRLSSKSSIPSSMSSTQSFLSTSSILSSHSLPYSFIITSQSNQEYVCSVATAELQQMWVEEIINAANLSIEFNPHTSTRSWSATDTNLMDRQNSSASSISSERDSLYITPSEMNSSSSTATISSQSSTTSSCSDINCNVVFRILGRHAHYCSSCSLPFCKSHCSRQAEVISPLDMDWETKSLRLESDMCDDCWSRQEFINFVQATCSRWSVLLDSKRSPLSMIENEGEIVSDWEKQQMLRELQLVASNSSTFSVLNIICMLRKYINSTWMFKHITCLLIQAFETNLEIYDVYWVEFVWIYVPLARKCATEGKNHLGTFDIYVSTIVAMCRRSIHLALRTVWECLAMYDDLRQGERDSSLSSYLWFLMYLVSSFNRNSLLMSSLFLENAPIVQSKTIVHFMDNFFDIYFKVGNADEMKHLYTKWLFAESPSALRQTSTEFQAILSNTSDHTSELLEHAKLTLEGSSFDTSDNQSVQLSDDDIKQITLNELSFNMEFQFVSKLAGISEILRLTTPVSERKPKLLTLLKSLQNDFFPSYAADEDSDAPTAQLYLPVYGVNAHQRFKLTSVIVDRGTVFSTKVRAPTMILMKALRISNNDADTDSEQDENEMGMFTSRLLSKFSKLQRQESEMLDELICSNVSEPSAHDVDSFRLTRRDLNSTILWSKMSNGSDILSSDSPSECVLSPESLPASSADITSSQSSPLTKSAQSSSFSLPNEDIVTEDNTVIQSVIVKSFDDVRQEVFAMQLMTTLQAVFKRNELHDLYLHPYSILCTGANVGIIETLQNSISLDAAYKKHGNLVNYFSAHFGEATSEQYHVARNNFIYSMAASSLFCYLFQVKDRHNGNIMIDHQGHIMNIDFGFMLGMAPGKSLSLEVAPFKLTNDMVEVMGGEDSPGYLEFQRYFMEGFMVARQEYSQFLLLLHLAASESPFPCFEKQTPDRILNQFRSRLLLKHSDEKVIKKVKRMVSKSFNHWGTRQYDKFQYSTNGIHY